jgi:hypothetical protein
MKELAKFFAGAFAWDCIAHLSIALSGSTPFRLFGFEITATANIVMVFVSAILSISLIYYAWIRKKTAINK